MRVIWSPLAIQRAGEAAAHIATDSPEAAARWVDRLFAAVDKLERLPRRGRLVPEVDRPDLREVFVGSYRVVYRVEARRLAVLTVRHMRRQFDPSEAADAP